MAKKSSIRAQARAGLDALLAASSEQDETAAGAKLREAMSHLVHAAGVLPPEVSLREVAAERESAGPRDRGLLERLGLDDTDLQLVREAGSVAGMQTGASSRKRSGEPLRAVGNAQEWRDLVKAGRPGHSS